MAEIYQLPDNGNSGGGNIPFTIPIGLNGNGFGNGFGSFNSIADLFGLAIIASMFGWGNGGFGGFGGFGGNAGTAGFLSNQLNNDSGRELIMNAVTSQGEATRTAVQSLATMLGQDFNLVNGAVQNVQNALSTLALQQAVSVPQIINSIQSGNASLASQLCKCCCDNQLAMCQQTNALQRDINGVNQSVLNKAAADQLAMCQQTYALTDQMNRNYLALDNKIDALESSRKDREISALTSEVANLKSQNFTTGVVQQAVAPILGQLANIQNEVDDIKCKMPETVSVQYPNLQVVNATPYVNGGFYGGNSLGWYSGNGFGNGVVF
ncbi:MAG: hypothetical protein IJT30_03320 [Muribaculaceae bacterium]|nr:hypothetical protein [Muribaculaceae bacterium]